jgi:hypothetical protein
MQKSLPCGANVVQGTSISEARTSIYGGFHTNTLTFVCNIIIVVPSPLPPVMEMWILRIT